MAKHYRPRRSDYHRPNIETYAALKVQLPNNVLFNGYFHDGELLGFATGLTRTN
jgi:hypothetical protein